MDRKQLNKGITEYARHLRAIAKTFNAGASQQGVPLRMSPEKAIKAVEAGIGIAGIVTHWAQERLDDTGIVHDSQLKTAIECLKNLIQDPKRCGHVLGAMQSGKTTTSLALQWAGPALYLLTGSRVYPFYIISSQTNHEDQTKVELERFLTFYGNIEIHVHGSAQAATVDDVFKLSPSLNTYREHVLRAAEQDVYNVPHLQDLVHRRVGGEQGVNKIVDLCKRATRSGYRPLMIIDEPQFGASDRIEPTESGIIRRPCVLVQVFDRIQARLGSTRDDHWFIGLSATPFELNDLERVWEVRQHLTKEYSGFNFFNGAPITKGVTITPPQTLGLTAFASQIDVPFLRSVSIAAYSARGKSFERHARKIGFSGTIDEYQTAVVAALRDCIYRIVEMYKGQGEPVGLCFRVFNDNKRTEDFFRELGLDLARIEILEYYGGDASGISVKRMVARRKRPDLPYIVLVTNRARMADAFPVQVRFFMDLAQRASDLNALLQGLLGRACGYGKRSTVVLSDANSGIVDAYVATSGGYVHKTSRHSVAVGGFRRGAPTGMLKIRAEMDNALVRRFFARIDKDVVRPFIFNGSKKLSAKRTGGKGTRMAPILRIAENLKLFDHIEKPKVRAKLFPHIPSGFSVARSQDEAQHRSTSGGRLRYSLDQDGSCRFTFRWLGRDEAAKGGAPGRAKGAKDAGQHMEPTVYVEKFDPSTDEPILDRDAPDLTKRGGNWRAFMVTFPLREPVRELRVAEVAYPTNLSPYQDWMTKAERDVRDSADVKGRKRSSVAR